jgi:hypothetical protein
MKPSTGPRLSKTEANNPFTSTWDNSY